MMSLVNDCRDFVQTWNERLDNRDVGSTEALLALADHAAQCDACGCLHRIFLEVESSPAPWSAIPAPSKSVLDGWRTAAIATRTVHSRSVRRRLVGNAAKWVVVATVAAAFLICGRASHKLLSLTEPDVGLEAQTIASTPHFEEAFAEAGSMTLELAREVSGPAARIGSEAFAWRGKRTPPASDLAQFDEDEPSTRLAPSPRQRVVAPDQKTAKVELLSGSARYAFRFLIGSTSDNSLKSNKTVGGF